MLTKESIVDNYIGKNKSIAQMCFEFSLTKKKFTNLCRKYGIVKDKLLQRKARVRSATYDLASFIKKAEVVHNNKYDYSKSVYVKFNVPIIIVCPVHGEFSQKPVTHLQGYGCQVCGGSRKLTTVDFIDRATKVHNGKYDYSLVRYENAKGKVVIICPVHGEFRQVSIKHLLGSGCPRCSNRITTKDFIEKAVKVHGDKYDYSLVDYKTTYENIVIVCKEHGKFEQTPTVHLRKCGCPMCNGGKKLSTSDFISRARSVHGDKYDYSLVDYRTAYSKVTIICREHGKFMQSAASHSSGSNCPKCTRNTQSDTNDFIRKAELVHGHRYDYSLVDYKSAHGNVVIICPEHGKFSQSATVHLGGSGCPGCANHVPMNTERFIKRARLVHGDKYDYSLVVCNNSFDKVKIICPVHGEFEQSPDNHLYNKGCSQCALDNSRLTTDEFINKAREIHGDKFDYSKVNYVKSDELVTIICSKHGDFLQTPNAHLKGNGCQYCTKLNTEDFIERSKLKHGDKFDYSKVDYMGCDYKVIIICPKHGEFRQIAWNHMLGQGCPRCNISKPQQEIANYIGDSSLCYNDRSVISPYEIDLYIGGRRLGFEVNGLFWHSYNHIESTAERNKHKFKQDLCEKVGIRLIQVFEHEWAFKRGIVESHIDVLLGRCNRIFARACEVVVLDSKGFNEFCGVNHLQGVLNSKVRYGLVYKGDLVMVMGFNGGGDFVCTRLCSRLGLVVVGGVSRLFSRFIRDYCPSSVVSFADRRYSVGGVYEKLGFKRLYVTSPNYFYVKGMEVFSRVRFQKHKLGGVLGLFDGSLTEAENMFLNGYRRLWDAGHIKYLWRA